VLASRELFQYNRSCGKSREFDRVTTLHHHQQSQTALPFLGWTTDTAGYIPSKIYEAIRYYHKPILGLSFPWFQNNIGIETLYEYRYSIAATERLNFGDTHLLVCDA
jgi:hypothetical protein